MSQLVVITFDSADEAEKVRDSLRQQAKMGNVSLKDTAVVVKDADGKIHVDNQVSQGTMIGTGIGALLGLVLGGLFMPLGGLLLGAGGGALMARLMDLGVDGKFVKEVGESLQLGTSALFVLAAEDANAAAVQGVLRNYKGTGKILQTTLDEAAEQRLKDALGDKSA